MGKTGKQNRQAPSKHARPWLLIWGALLLALVVGAGTWYLLPRQNVVPAVAEYRGGPRLTVETDAIDLGPVKFNKMVQAGFRVRNVGDQPLTLAANPQVEVVEGC